MSLLQGKWYFVSTSINGETELYDDHEPCGKDYLEFLPNNVIKQVDVWDCDGNNPVSSEYEATYTTSGNKITLGVEGQSNTVTVQKLTNSELEVTYKEDWDEDGNEETIIERMSRN